MEKERINIKDLIQEELEKEAEDIEKRIGALPSGEGMSADIKARIHENLRGQIAEYELSKRYPDMSEEDRRALLLGQELLRRKAEARREVEVAEEFIGEVLPEEVLAEKKVVEKEAVEKASAGRKLAEKEAVEKELAEREALGKEPEEPKAPEKVVYRRRQWKYYAGFAAVLVLVCGIGVTSLGGPARIVRFLKGIVGNREVVQVDSGEDNLVIVKESEEETYEIIKKEFGVEPVKIMGGLREVQFQYMEYDKTLQFAELVYSYDEEKLIYCISALYRAASWGIDIEDKIVNQYQIEKKDCLIDVTEYETEKTKTRTYSANFKFGGLEYFLIGTMEKAEFEEIIKNLYFFH